MRPACYSPAPAREISVVGSYYPLQNDLDVARQAQSTSNPDQVPTTTTGNETTGRRLFTMDVMNEASYMLVDIRPIGQIVRPAEQAAPTIAEVNGTFQGYTFAKARVTWQEEGSGTRSMDVDIGSGICFSTPPSFQVSADLLIPSDRNREFLDGLGSPANYPDFDQLRFYTTVACKVTCVSSPSNTRPCLTRQVFLQQDNTGRQYIAAPPYARDVRLTANSTAVLTNDTPDVVFNYITLATATGGAVSPSGLYAAGDSPPFPAPRAPFNPDDHTSGSGRIPGGSNAITAILVGDRRPAVATATFCLGVP